MLTDKWAKIFSLVKKTREKIIVVDESGDNALVVMPLEEYEQMLSTVVQVKGLTEEEMLDRINQDIARWQASQPEILPVVEKAENKAAPEKKVEDDEERYYVEPLE